jgi:cyclopropane-fatty-acyl-phospholipid synthase
VLRPIERSGLLVADIEILRLHYAETLKHWRERFLAHLDDVQRIYDQRFVRMWEFYLAACEMSFREQGMMVMQIQLTRRQGVVPMTRDYITRAESRLRSAEGKHNPPLRLAGE